MSEQALALAIVLIALVVVAGVVAFAFLPLVGQLAHLTDGLPR